MSEEYPEFEALREAALTWYDSLGPEDRAAYEEAVLTASGDVAVCERAQVRRDLAEAPMPVEQLEEMLAAWRADSPARAEQAEADAARLAEDLARAERVERIAQAKALDPETWWVGMDDIEADVPAGELRDLLLTASCAGDWQEPPVYGALRDDAPGWLHPVVERLRAHWGHGIVCDFQSRLGARPESPQRRARAQREWAERAGP